MLTNFVLIVFLWHLNFSVDLVLDQVLKNECNSGNGVVPDQNLCTESE